MVWCRESRDLSFEFVNVMRELMHWIHIHFQTSAVAILSLTNNFEGL